MKFYTLIVLLITALLLSCSPKTGLVTAPVEPVTPPSDPTPPTAPNLLNTHIAIDNRVTIGELSNGMKYYIQKNVKPENRAELRLAVNAGSILEDEDQLGLAHFVEHMAFNGTENFEKSELVDYLESTGTRFGADLNAYTSFDETVYQLQVRTDSTELFDKGLLILKDWATGVTFDNDEIDKERGVVESEWRNRLSPDQRMQNEYFPVLYHNSLYAQRLPIGDPEIIKHATYETIKRFYNDWYRPDLMALIVVGDIDIAIVEKQLEEVFGSIPAKANPRERKTYNVPMHDETLVKIVDDEEASFTRVTLVYKHDRIETKTMDDMRSSLIRRSYNGMLNARLSELTKTPNPPFIFGGSFYGQDVGDIDSYTSSAMAAEGEVEEALRVLMIENKRVQEHGFTSSEFERQKANMIESVERGVKEMDKTDSRRLASRYVYHYLDGNPIPSPEDGMAMTKRFLPTIELSEINNLAKEWIKDTDRVVVLTGPRKPETPLPTESAVRKLLDEVAVTEVDPFVDEVATTPFFDEKLSETLIEENISYDASGIEFIKLANGVEVYLKKTDFKNDEVLLRATSDGGLSLYNEDEYQNGSNATAITIESGISNFTSIQFQKLMAGKNVRVRPYIAALSEGFSGSASPDDLEIMFQMIYLYFTNPRFDEEAFQSYINKQKEIYSNLLSNPQYYFADYSTKKKYDNHPRLGWPSAESLDNLDFNEVQRIYKERFANASDFVFSFVGNYDDATIKSYAQKYLGNLPVTDKEEDWKDIGIKVVEGKVMDRFKNGKAPKTNVEMYFHGPYEYDRDKNYQISSMLAYLRLKLRESLREDKGGVYGVQVYGGGQKKPREQYSVTVAFNSDPEKTDELIDAAKEVIEKARTEVPSELDMTKVKETQRQGRIKSLKENRFWQGQIMRRQDENKDFENISLEAFEELVNSLTPEQIRDAADKYFNYDSFIQIVMEPEELNEN